MALELNRSELEREDLTTFWYLVLQINPQPYLLAAYTNLFSRNLAPSVFAPESRVTSHLFCLHCFCWLLIVGIKFLESFSNFATLFLSASHLSLTPLCAYTFLALCLYLKFRNLCFIIVIDLLLLLIKFYDQQDEQSILFR